MVRIDFFTQFGFINEKKKNTGNQKGRPKNFHWNWTKVFFKYHFPFYYKFPRPTDHNNNKDEISITLYFYLYCQTLTITSELRCSKEELPFRMIVWNNWTLLEPQNIWQYWYNYLIKSNLTLPCQISSVFSSLSLAGSLITIP